MRGNSAADPFIGRRLFLFTGSLLEREEKNGCKTLCRKHGQINHRRRTAHVVSQAGNVSAVDIIKDRDSGQSKGFGFVTMTDQTEAEKAISMYNAYSLAEHELKVNVAKPRVER